MTKYIQVALDTLDSINTLNIARRVLPYVNIIELGTPCVKYNGLNIVKSLNELNDGTCQILADLKTMDAGFYESFPFYEAGADIVTVLGASDPGTIAGVIKAANEFGVKAQVDLINVEDKVKIAKMVADMGAHIIGIHTGLDAQAAGKTPFEDLKRIVDLGLSVEISCAGGINKDTIRNVFDAGANIAVVGAAIYGAKNPAAAAKLIREAAYA